MLIVCIEAVTADGVTAKILSIATSHLKWPTSDPSSIEVTDGGASIEAASLRQRDHRRFMPSANVVSFCVSQSGGEHDRQGRPGRVVKMNDGCLTAILFSESTLGSKDLTRFALLDHMLSFASWC